VAVSLRLRGAERSGAIVVNGSDLDFGLCWLSVVCGVGAGACVPVVP